MFVAIPEEQLQTFVDNLWDRVLADYVTLQKIGMVQKVPAAEALEGDVPVSVTDRAQLLYDAIEALGQAEYKE